MNRFYSSLLLCSVFLLVSMAIAQQPAPATKGNSTGPAQAGQAGASSDVESPDPLLDTPPLPKGTVSLVGGTVKNVDHIRNRIAVQPFGSGATMKMRFDERSHFYRDGRETTQLGVKQGDRVYVDTQLDADRHIFARNVRVESNTMPADASGQVIAYDPTRGTLTVLDQLSSQPITFSLDQGTQLKRLDGAASTRDLVPGTLLSVRFAPGRGRRGTAQEISIIAVPGSIFTFTGSVTHLDTSIGLLGVESTSDNKRYDIHFAPGTPGLTTALTEGSDVTVEAVFDGSKYNAKSISMSQARAQ